MAIVSTSEIAKIFDEIRDQRDAASKRAEQAEAERDKLRDQLKQAKDKIAKKISEIKSDERYTYPAANVFVNAPLALIQVELEARVSALEFALKAIEAMK